MDNQEYMMLLAHIIKHHLTRGVGVEPAAESLVSELELQGFRRTHIENALSWVEGMFTLDVLTRSVSQQTVRVLTAEERQILGEEGYAYLLFLRKANILNAVTLECVIDRVVAFGSHETDTDLIEWITMVVLYSLPDIPALRRMELLVYNEFEGVH